MSRYAFAGTVTGIALKEGKCYAAIEIVDPRFPLSTDTIHVETSEFSLGENVTVVVLSGEQK